MRENIQKMWSERGKFDWLILVLCGVMILLSLPGKSKTDFGLPEGSSRKEMEQSQTLEEEKRLQKILESTKGIGRTRVMITYQDEKKECVEGVLVVAERAEDARIREMIYEAVEVLYHIESCKIKVLPLSENKLK